VKKARKFEDRKVYFQANLSLFERKEMRVSRAIVAAAIDTRRKSDDLDQGERFSRINLAVANNSLGSKQT
jgi:hypothetical protein